MQLPPDDNFSRHSDPVKRRNATIVGVLLATSVAALATGLWVARNQPHPTQPIVAVTAGSTPSGFTPPGFTPPSLIPTPVPKEPVVGSGFSVADDPSTRQLVVFGGIDSYDSTWVWDGHRWSLARPPISPPGRFAAAIAYDPVTRMVMLYGGRLGPGQVVDDTWAWDGARWRELDGGTGNPPIGEGSVMSWDDPLNEMVLVGGGQTWIWDGLRWVRQPGGDQPSDTFFVGLAVDPVTRTLIAASCCSAGQGSTSTWAWNGTHWRRIGTRAQPTFTVALALDPAGGRVLLFAAPVLAAGREMWAWSGKDWSLLTGARLPVFAAGAVSDTNDNHLVILGSFGQPVQGSPQPIHLWSWTDATWRQLA